LTVFGATAVSMMALAYALEQRHRAFIALFAMACALASAYGFLIGSLPSARSKRYGARSR
jgi:hypothetical protein